MTLGPLAGRGFAHKRVYSTMQALYNALVINQEPTVNTSTIIIILHAERTDFDHKFIELFTSNDLVNAYLVAHPDVRELDRTCHELNPA